MFIKCLTVGPIDTNCYILCDKVENKAVIIDPGFDARRIVSALNDTQCQAAYVILTHGHSDHMSAASGVLEKTGAALAVFAGELPLLADPEQNLHYQFNKTPFMPLAPHTVLYDGDKLTAGRLEISVMHTPGHTAGSCCLICQDTIFSGDTMFLEGAGRTDMPTGSLTDLRRSLQRLAALEGEYQVLPGHGGFTTLSHERQHNPFFHMGEEPV